MNTAEIVEAEQVIATVPSVVPMDLMLTAVNKGASVEVLERLMGLTERWEANQARKAFDAAMAAARAELPVIRKNRRVDFSSPRGRTRYSYEDLAEIADAINPILGEHGLSYRFRTECTPDTIKVTCIVSHRDGHSEHNTLSAGHDASGNKNSIQAIGSAVTYLQRYTLKAALGLAAGEDDDAQSVGKSEPKKLRTGEDYNEEWEALLAKATEQDVSAVRLKWETDKTLRDHHIDWEDSEQRFATQSMVQTWLDKNKAKS